MIPFNKTPYVGNEQKYMEEAIKDRRICGDGQFTERCSNWIEERTKTAKALLTTSCTHATEMAALLADIQPGDEVIMPSFTFVSTADAFVLRGAKAVFIDIRPDTMNMDEKLIEDAVTDKARSGGKLAFPAHLSEYLPSRIKRLVICADTPSYHAGTSNQHPFPLKPKPILPDPVIMDPSADQSRFILLILNLL